MDSFRYDLQGQGGESEGLWTMGGHDLDADDLEVVIAYLERMGYRIALSTFFPLWTVEKKD